MHCLSNPPIQYKTKPKKQEKKYKIDLFSDSLMVLFFLKPYFYIDSVVMKPFKYLLINNRYLKGF